MIITDHDIEFTISLHLKMNNKGKIIIILYNIIQGPNEILIYTNIHITFSTGGYASLLLNNDQHYS